MALEKMPRSGQNLGANSEYVVLSLNILYKMTNKLTI